MYKQFILLSSASFCDFQNPPLSSIMEQDELMILNAIELKLISLSALRGTLIELAFAFGGRKKRILRIRIREFSCSDGL